MQEQHELDQGTDTATDVETQATATRNFSQEDLDKIVADRVARERKKYERRFEGVNIERYQALVDAEEARKVEDQKKRGEFEEILKTTVSKKDTQISQLRQELQSIKVDGSLLSAASSARAVNPEQVVRLLKDQVRLGDSGEVEILDPQTQQVRYNDSGELLSVKELVGGFLSSNPHFLTASPAGAGTGSNTRSTNSSGKLDISNLDMKNPEHRKIYAEYRKGV